MVKKIKPQIVFMFFLLSLFFVPQISFGAQNGLDGTCTVPGDCILGLSCYNNACKECQTTSDCAFGYSCDNGICLRPGGNSANAFCRAGYQCQSGSCGANNLCSSYSVPSTSPSISPAPSSSGLPGQDLKIQDVFNIINGLACWLLRTVGAVMVIFLVIAGLRYMAAGGDPKKVIEARKSLNYALLGILVIMGVYVIIATVANAVGSSFSLIPLVC